VRLAGAASNHVHEQACAALSAVVHEHADNRAATAKMLVRLLDQHEPHGAWRRAVVLAARTNAAHAITSLARAHPANQQALADEGDECLTRELRMRGSIHRPLGEQRASQQRADSERATQRSCRGREHATDCSAGRTPPICTPAARRARPRPARPRRRRRGPPAEEATPAPPRPCRRHPLVSRPRRGLARWPPRRRRRHAPACAATC
jgi:hypothetical protein